MFNGRSNYCINVMTNEELVKLGYRVVSRRHKYVSRIDRPDWKEYLAREYAPWDINEGFKWIERLGYVSAEDHYRRVYSKDILELVSLDDIPSSCGAETGYVEK